MNRAGLSARATGVRGSDTPLWRRTETAAGTEPADTFIVLHVALAVENMEKMVAFYETVFGVKLGSYEIQGIRLYEGKIHGLKFLFAPNELAGVDARQSRHQFELAVTDIDAVAANASATGGNLRDGIQINGENRVLVVEDPDGNTIVFHQRS